MFFKLSQTISGYALWLNFERKKPKGEGGHSPDPEQASPTGLITREQMVLRLQLALESPEGLNKTQIAGLYRCISDSMRPENLHF